jgi:hypothetical protein
MFGPPSKIFVALLIFAWTMSVEAKIGDFCKKGEASGTCQKISNCESGEFLTEGL